MISRRRIPDSKSGKNDYQELSDAFSPVSYRRETVEDEEGNVYRKSTFNFNGLNLLTIATYVSIATTPFLPWLTQSCNEYTQPQQPQSGYVQPQAPIK